MHITDTRNGIMISKTRLHQVDAFQIDIICPKKETNYPCPKINKCFFLVKSQKLSIDNKAEINSVNGSILHHVHI